MNDDDDELNWKEEKTKENKTFQRFSQRCFVSLPMFDGMK